MASNTKNTIDSKTALNETDIENPNRIHTDATPRELKEIKRDISIMSVIQRQVAETTEFPLAVAGIVAQYSFDNVYVRTVRKLVRKQGISKDAKYLLMRIYPSGVVRVGEGKCYDDCRGQLIPLWDLYVVYVDPFTRVRMINFWHWEDWPDMRCDETYAQWNNKEYPKPLGEFWKDRDSWSMKHIKWYGMVPGKLGRTVRSYYGIPHQTTTTIHWKPEDPDSEDEHRFTYGYDCDTHQTTYNQRLVQAPWRTRSIRSALPEGQSKPWTYAMARYSRKRN